MQVMGRKGAFMNYLHEMVLMQSEEVSEITHTEKTLKGQCVINKVELN